MWAAWHVPLVYMVGYFEGTTFDPELWWWLPSIVLTPVVGTWVYNNTGRSVLAVIVLHFVGNLTGETVEFASELYPFVHLGTALVAILLVAGGAPDRSAGGACRVLWQTGPSIRSIDDPGRRRTPLAYRRWSVEARGRDRNGEGNGYGGRPRTRGRAQVSTL